MKINIDTILINDRLRAINDDKVSEIVDSIREIGLLNPITVTKNHELIAGLHRLQAYKKLGYNEIEANVIDLTGLKQELAEIDENLIRHDLHFIDRGDHLKRRKEIYEELYPETKAKVAGAVKTNTLLKTKQEVAKPEYGVATPKSFVEEIADKTGWSKSKIKEEIQISKNLAPEIKEKVKQADISKTDTIKLSRLEPEKQKKIVEKAIEKKEKVNNIIKEIDQVGGGMSDHSRKILFSNAHDNWGTPKEIYDSLNNEFNFDFDPCPLDSKVDGLKIPWQNSNFINPPYSNIIGFLEKGHEELKNGNAKTLVYLIPVRTDTKWFHTYIYPHFKKEVKPYAEIRFIKGRIKFKNGDEITNSAPFPSMVVIFRSD